MLPDLSCLGGEAAPGIPREKWAELRGKEPAGEQNSWSHLPATDEGSLAQLMQAHRSAARGPGVEKLEAKG